ncbi:MAG: histidine phosphatase family protein [Ahniella sp.]|nr:histidine phosphatase family protein [Ahniella sp.]
MTSKRFVFSVGLAAALAACSGTSIQPEPITTTVVILRHAEKAADSDDPGLTEAGRIRAESIANRFCRDGLRAAHATQYQRTQQTAEPCARVAGRSVQVTTLSKDFEADAKALRATILAAPGGKVLVVGHSNTVPILVNAFTGVVVAPIGEQEYDRWFEVTLDADGQGRLVETRY